MGKAITMEDLEKINFPYYYNKVKNGEMKRKEAADLLFNGNEHSYSRYKNVMEGKPTYTEARKEYRKEYRQTPEGKAAKARAQHKYFQTPKGKAVQKRAKHKRRAKVKENGGTWTLDEWNQCLVYFDYRDAYTGEPLTTTEMEHIMPLSKGGTNNIYNIVPANKSTNASKNNSDLWEWYSQQPYFSWERYLKICLWIIKNGGASRDINIKE